MNVLMNEELSLSDAGANLIKHFESCMKQVGPDQFKAYKCPANVPTIGWGHTNHQGQKFDMSTIWTANQCDGAFMEDVVQQEDDVKRLVKVSLMGYQFDALCSLVYNIGPTAFAKSTLLRKLNKGDYEGAALEFHRWNKAGGKVLKGLVRRRASESLLFQNIADENYDGEPDAIQPMGEPMPQAVDDPEGVVA